MYIPGQARSIRYRSAGTWMGWPVVDVALGPDPARGESRGSARGVIAVGDTALGLVAVGGSARGEIAVGGLALGGVCCGDVCAGVVSLGGIALGGRRSGCWPSAGARLGGRSSAEPGRIPRRWPFSVSGCRF